MDAITIRAYERPELPIDERLGSLARRFPCLKGARGVAPFAAAELHAWARTLGAHTPGFHGAMLILNLFGAGPWAPFDAVAAARIWGDADKKMFANWLLVWRF
jgi:hypothetical protein